MTAHCVFEIIDPGLQTTVQSWPGRTGLTEFGFFPAGPMDHLSFRLANLLVGNPIGAAALEIPKVALRMAAVASTQIAIAAPPGTGVLRNGTPMSSWETIGVSAGDELQIVATAPVGYRAYLAVQGGIDVPVAYGSQATSLIAGVGGLEGRALVRGDTVAVVEGRDPIGHRRLPEEMRPRFTKDWEIELVAGPHAAPDTLTATDWEELIGMHWRVDVNSDRVSTRLHPHRFRWSVNDDLTAGGHPSNVLDEAYPVGALLANGDVLTILGMEGNTSGGFRVVGTIPECGLWKIGQVRPGRDTVRFREVDYDEALALRAQTNFVIDPKRLGS